MRNAFYFLLLVLAVVGLTHVFKHFIDYPVYELAARRVLTGDLAHLYDLQRTGPGGFYYSYFFALAFTPFAFAGPTAGRVLFCTLFFLSYCHIVYFSLQNAAWLVDGNTKNLKRYYLTGCLTLLLTTYALNDAFMNSNIGILLLSLSILAFSWRDRRPFWSGLTLAVAIVFKVYPVILLCFFIWSKHWRVVTWTIVLGVLLYFGLPYLIYGPETGKLLVHNQLYVLSHFDQHWGYEGHVFQNFHATAIRLGSLIGITKDTAFRISLVSSCSLVVFLFLKSFLVPVKELSQRFQARMFILILLFVPLLVPVSWYNMALFYTPLISYLTYHWLAKRDRTSLGALSTYTLLYCLTTPDIVGRPFNRKLAFHGVPFFGIMALVVVYLLGLVKEFPKMFFFANLSASPRKSGAHAARSKGKR